MAKNHLTLRVAISFLLMLAFTVVALPGSVYADHGPDHPPQDAQGPAVPPTTGGPGQSTVDVAAGRECENGEHRFNPHCTAPEVPFAVIYPVVGAAMFAGFLYLRSRRSQQLISP